MKKLIIMLIITTSISISSQESIGKDSGNRNIMMYSYETKSEVAMIIIGGMHGDEFETADTIYYIRNNLKSDISTYFIPTINPTLTSPSVRRRGYNRDQLNSNGFLLENGDPSSFNKELYYRIFYGNQQTYKQGIKNFVDPNRDFVERLLPSTRILIKLLTDLSEKYKEVILISLHGYMNGGRIYPEYEIVNNNGYNINLKSWDYSKRVSLGSGFVAEEMYSPAISILERFNGELITYTSSIKNLFGMDIELDSNNRLENSKKVLNGIKNLLIYIESEN